MNFINNLIYTPMTQEQINKYFASSLGEQCNSLYSTSDNKVFIRKEEALEHEATLTNQMDNITEWFEEYVSR